MVKGLNDLISLDNLIIEPKACINHLNRETVCQACKENCPTNAIKLVNGLPVINHLSCINCGACISACPTLAIDHIQKPYINISKQVEQHPKANITCDQHEAYQKGIKVPCYLYLDLSLLLQVGNGKKEITFYTEKCTTCPKSEVISVKQHIEGLQRELEHYHIPFSIQVNDTELDDKEDQAIDGLTRRELFKKFSIKNVREALFEEGEERKTEKETKNLTVKERARFKRKLFNQHILMETKEMAMTLPDAHFLHIKVTDACSGCNVCEKICPTQAIYWENDVQGNSQLLFNLQQCIGCKKCAACPEGAIYFEPVRFEDYVKQGIKRLKTYQLKECVICGEEFRTMNNVDTCSFCEAQKNKNPK